jgi:osmoprotectant transport system permease protein
VLAWQYTLSHADEFLLALREHLFLVTISMIVGILVCVPLGVWTARSKKIATAALNTVNTLRVIPSLAILFLLIPYLGLSSTSALIALIVLALPPILINSDAAFRGISPAILEAARGMGMKPHQILFQIEFPLAAPVILTGIRIAAVEVIASATLAAFVGSGGLGIYITRGFALYDYSILFVGAVPVALLTLFSEGIISGAQKLIQYPQ